MFKKPPKSPVPDSDDPTQEVDPDNEPGLRDMPTANISGEDADAAERLAETGSADDTEDVVVILPEDADQFPVVETMVVEDQAWESGPTTTEVLKDDPTDLTGEETAPAQSLEDVPLVKSNPFSEVETEDVPSVGAEPITDRVRPAGSGEREEEIKVIDEIADIAADLEHEEPLDEEADDRSARLSIPRAVGGAASAGSRRFRVLAMFSSLAALVLVGVFFYPELERLYFRYIGGEAGTVASGGSGQVEAEGRRRPGGTGGPGVVLSAREELRAKVLLAVDLGLRADAGKE